MKDAVRVSCLIVNYQCGDYLRECLRSVFAQLGRISFEVIVVDNASTDGSVLAAQALNLPARWICSTENLGFARANNLAAVAAEGEFLLLLNPDTELLADCVSPLVNYLEAHPEIGMIGGHHEDANGSWQRSFGLIPNLRHEFEYALAPARFWERLSGTPPEIPTEVGWLYGSFIVLRRSLTQRIGLFDERFFLNDEDIELADRIHAEGLKVIYHPGVGIKHYGGVSKALSPTSSREYYRSRRAYYRSRHGRLSELLYLVAYQLRWWRDRVSAWKKENSSRLAP